ncbi:MAG TPA: phosphoribosylformylglycinamidine synthase, partial [Firmicutes bacterium]|nr:phosphoribosylformylglycinamidine synthase [Bacillota bacterium]
MSSIKTLILKTAGINCDEELAHAFRMAGSDAEIVHINEFSRGRR